MPGAIVPNFKIPSACIINCVKTTPLSVKLKPIFCGMVLLPFSKFVIGMEAPVVLMSV